jgi:hypothetical protein
MAHKFPIEHLIGDRVPEEIAADLEVSTRTVQRWIITGVNWEQADVFAAKALKMHPMTAFGPEWLDIAEAEAPRQEESLSGHIFDGV